MNDILVLELSKVLAFGHKSISNRYQKSLVKFTIFPTLEKSREEFVVFLEDLVWILGIKFILINYHLGTY